MNDRYYLEITVQVHGIDRDQLEAKFGQIADAVYNLTDVIDADLGADFGARRLDFTMAVDAPTGPQALEAALVAVRCAIHEAGGSTRGWEKHFEEIQGTVRKEQALTPA